MIVASSDATNLKNTTAVVNGDKITLSGHKWVSSSLSLVLLISLSLILLMTTTKENTKRKYNKKIADISVDLRSR
jgi:alkylation response protein AidB-like acyl-CoA dehydrogenase